jgi:hypothetical protein
MKDVQNCKGISFCYEVFLMKIAGNTLIITGGATNFGPGCT